MNSLSISLFGLSFYQVDSVIQMNNESTYICFQNLEKPENHETDLGFELSTDLAL